MRMIILVVAVVFTLKGLLAFSTLQVEKKIARRATEAFLDTLKDLHIRFSEVVLSQMIHETAMFSSPIYRENHNCVGMKWNRRGYATGVNRGHAKYPNIWECLKDYSDWQAKYCPARITTNEEYIDWLIDFGYAEDTLYRNHITRTLKIVQNE